LGISAFRLEVDHFLAAVGQIGALVLLKRWSDVLIDTKEVRRVVLLFRCRQARIVVAVSRLEPGLAPSFGSMSVPRRAFLNCVIAVSVSMKSSMSTPKGADLLTFAVQSPALRHVLWGSFMGDCPVTCCPFT
jgi:hypothetical protein